MTKADFISVVEKMRLPDGRVFPLPILLPVKKNDFKKIVLFSSLNLFYNNVHVGNIYVEDVFQLSLGKYLKKIFGTNDKKHPGIAMMLKLGNNFIGGKVKLIKKIKKDKSQLEISPRELKKLFKKKNYKTIAGFQTRNIPHKAHEFIHRLALEQVDGLLIQPIVGEKKEGDFTAEAVMQSYEYLIDNYYPKRKVVLTSLSTFMRYAGPREAIFHALIRRNYGCTHFIVGRDHAGVSNYYKVYEAQDLSKKFEKELGIKILSMKGPFYCNKCESIVTENSCPHKSNSVNYIEEISGTKIRSMILGKIKINKKFLRPDLLKKIIKLNLFIEKK
jgi:sulfate adenylyltransferase